MSNYKNRSIVLARRPEGEIRDGDLVMETGDVREIEDDEFLIRTLWLSLDPYMRPRMNDVKSYMQPMAIGEVMTGETVGRVIESKTDRYQVGDIVTCYTGWQDYFIADEVQEIGGSAAAEVGHQGLLRIDIHRDVVDHRDLERIGVQRERVVVPILGHDHG